MKRASTRASHVVKRRCGYLAQNAAYYLSEHIMNNPVYLGGRGDLVKTRNSALPLAVVPS